VSSKFTKRRRGFDDDDGGDFGASRGRGRYQPLEAAQALFAPSSTRPAEPASEPVKGRVKWYSAQKRFGFINLLSDNSDAFLPGTAVGDREVPAGATVTVRVADDRGRGPAVTEVLDVDVTTAPRLAEPPARQLPPATHHGNGTVTKWRGTYGFLALDDDRGDGEIVFVTGTVASAARRTLEDLEGARGAVGFVYGDRGAVAVSFKLLPDDE